MSECVPLLPAARWWRGRLATLARVQGFLRIGGWLPVQTRGKVRRRHAPGCSRGEILTDGISPSPSLRPCLWDQRHGTFETFTIPSHRHLTLQLLLFLDLLARQNYWDPAIGLWPTHTVSKWSRWLHPAPSHVTTPPVSPQIPATSTSWRSPPPRPASSARTTGHTSEDHATSSGIRSHICCTTHYTSS